MPDILTGNYMKLSKNFNENGYRKRTPLWKWVVIILVVIAMPLFFAYYRMANLQFVIKNTMPGTTTTNSKP
jgi:hypothetical protein